MRGTIIFASEDCGICHLACYEWFTKIMPSLSGVMEDKENQNLNVLQHVVAKLNRFFRSQDQHCLLTHRKYTRCIMKADIDLVYFPLLVDIGYTYKKQMTMTFGNIFM